MLVDERGMYVMSLVGTATLPTTLDHHIVYNHNF